MVPWLGPEARGPDLTAALTSTADHSLCLQNLTGDAFLQHVIPSPAVVCLVTHLSRLARGSRCRREAQQPAVLSSCSSKAQHRVGSGESSLYEISEISTYRSEKREVTTSTTFLWQDGPTQQMQRDIEKRASFSSRSWQKLCPAVCFHLCSHSRLAQSQGEVPSFLLSPTGMASRDPGSQPLLEEQRGPSLGHDMGKWKMQRGLLLQELVQARMVLIES